MAGMQTEDKHRVIYAKVQKQLEGAYEMSRQRYDKLLAKPGQEVFILDGLRRFRRCLTRNPPRKHEPSSEQRGGIDGSSRNSLR